MRLWVAVAGGVVLLAAALIVAAPASLLDVRVASISGDRVRIANASGTIWRGSGDLVASGSGMREHIAWRLEPWALLRGEARGTIMTDVDRGGSFVVGRDRIELEGLDWAMPMEALLRAAGAPSLIAAAGGDFAVHVDRFIRDDDALDVALAVQWHNASLPGLGPFARVMLGDVRVEMSGRGHEVSGPLNNSGGEVEIDGTVTAVAGSVPRVEASIRPRAGVDRERAASLAAALSTLGQPDPRGGYRIAWPVTR
jgi:general secretion pathway protein N